MAQTIMNGSGAGGAGSQYLMVVNSDGSINISGTVTSSSNSFGTLLAGSITTTSSSGISLGSSTVTNWLTVQNDVNNADAMFIGNSTNQFVRLDIGQTIDMQINDLSKVYIKRSSSNVTANYIGA